MISRLHPILNALGLSVLAFLGHVAIAHFLNVANGLPLLGVLYSALFAAATIIILILLQVMRRNIDTVGYTFMLLTSIKMVIVYLVFKTFAQDLGVDGLPKGHLIAAFFVMLGIETFCTIRMVNNK